MTPGEANSATGAAPAQEVTGEFVNFSGERYYVIRNVDQMAPFLVSVVSNSDHWLFLSSTGGLTAGRISPEAALFPYTTVDKIHDSWLHTGPKTLLKVGVAGEIQLWEPFNREHNDRYSIDRHLYKNLLGNKVCFEETNHDLGLIFRYTWMSSDDYGFVRHCELENLSDSPVTAEILDGIQNVLPAGTPRFAQTNTSNLVDAYKWAEVHEPTGLAMYALYSGITDRAEPSESLRANTVFGLGIDAPVVQISSNQLKRFRQGAEMTGEARRRGIRGAYFTMHNAQVAPRAVTGWYLVANVEQSQGQVVELLDQLADPAGTLEQVTESVDQGSDHLARIMARADGFQATAEENVAVHHYANVLFNVLRGGIFSNQYDIDSADLASGIAQFNNDVAARNRDFLKGLPSSIDVDTLRSLVRAKGDLQLERLIEEYLPITFGRRHGDPSRPWNQFAINLKDDNGVGLHSYQGNWRDIFQNWEALALSYPQFIENFISKFVNASTADGYNPYRITQEGIDWEVEEPDNPWSNIGYWGDHQIIYLQKFLELSRNFEPDRLRELLRRPIFSYANVPYRIRPLQALLNDPKNTVDYDGELATTIERRVAAMGADGKLILDKENAVYQVNLLEKLLVSLLAKLGNLVIDGGIWMNTQRPEWNDANNALVGQGISVVTLCYMRRYIAFLQELLRSEKKSFALSAEVAQWFEATSAALRELQPRLGSGPISPAERHDALCALGTASSAYREGIYAQQSFSGTADCDPQAIVDMLGDALAAIDHTITTNMRDDGLFQAYNTLHIDDGELAIERLYTMLEGQVAVLSAGVISPQQSIAVVEALFTSDVYRDDQNSFLLYPDRQLPGFLERNLVPPHRAQRIPLVKRMLEQNDDRILYQDANGCYRFNANFTNARDLHAELGVLAAEYGDAVDADRAALAELYEMVFQHKSFTGRSGTMFGFEGLGSIYWHMVAKLLLATQENFFDALDSDVDSAILQRLGDLYYRIRRGIGFNKSPAEYGAFPTDPYSHTPAHAGARQPGMTGQVKEEILSRFGEFGVRVADGSASFNPRLLRAREFCSAPQTFCYLDVDDNWQDLTVPVDGLAFTWCQTPVVYRLDDSVPSKLEILLDDGTREAFADFVLPAKQSAGLFRRNGRVRRITATFSRNALFVAS